VSSSEAIFPEKKQTRIEAASLGDDAGIVGAALLGMEI
jgi:predicted NBD/HSP70 family sugar kinase